MNALVLMVWSLVASAFPIIVLNDSNHEVVSESLTQLQLQESATPPTAEQWIDIGDGLDFRYYFTTSNYGETYILGEVRNRTDSAVPSPSISLTLLDGDGNIVGAQSLIDLYPIVEPETPTPYQVWLDPSIVPGSWETETVEAYSTAGFGPTTCSTGLEFRDVVEEEKSSEWLRISGKIYNGGTAPLDGVIIWAATYRSDGVFAGMVNESIGTIIPPDKTAAFSMFGSLMADLSPDYTYRLFATNITGGSAYC